MIRRSPLLIALCAAMGIPAANRPAGAQVTDPISAGPGATITGVVTDSIAQAPLAGATVQLVAADGPSLAGLTATADARGFFRFSGVPDGRFLIGFFHPLLDSLGLEPRVGEVTVSGGETVHVELAIPSARRLRTMFCGTGTGEPDALVVGFVRDARDGSAVEGARVSAEWAEFSLNRLGGVRDRGAAVAITPSSGRYVLCNVPRSGVVGLVASLGADSTDMVELDVPEGALLRRDLFLAAAPVSGVADEPGATDMPGASLPVRRSGSGRLSGRVVTALEGTPIAGARVSIQDGPQTRTDEEGDWVLANVPLGTRTLAVQAVGYYPDRVVVDVVPGAPSLNVALPTMKAVLDTVRVIARSAHPRLRAFEERRRSGAGRYLSAADIARVNPIVTSDVFRMLPGMRVDRGRFGENVVHMRGIFSERCMPNFYIDGMHMRTLTADDVDGMISPDEAAGIEIYMPGHAPPEFDPGLGGCGSIVIWTTPRVGPLTMRPMRQRVTYWLGMAALGVLAGVLITTR